MSPRSTVCILSFSEIARDARVLRHVKFLGRRFRLVVIGFGESPAAELPGVEMEWHRLPEAEGGLLRKIIRTLLRWPGRLIPSLDWLPDLMMNYWREARRILKTARYDLFLGNDACTLLLGVWQQRETGRPFVMDYHEFAPLEAEEKRWHRWFHGPRAHRLLQRYGRLAAGSTTVNTMFAERFQRDYGFPALTVMNAPDLQPLPEAAPNPDGRIHLVFHGNAGADRNLGALIGAVKLLDERFVLHLMLTAGGEEGSVWRQQAAGLEGRVVFENPVKPSQIVTRLAGWDIGFNILEPLNYNHRHALPNKFFDYIHAGLATVCSPTITAQQFVEEHGIGWVLGQVTPESIAGLLSAVSPEEVVARKAAAGRLRQTLHAESEERVLVELVERSLASRV